MTPTSTNRTRLARCLVSLLGAVVMLFTGVGLAGLADAAGTQAPGRPVIVDVTGDAENGFGVHYADGSEIFPPTTSEMIAECGEYDTQVARVRCRAVNRTWYRDLGDLQRSLAWERAHG
jgi:hypothetical protein